MWLLCLFLGRLRFSAACPAAGYPLRVPQSFWLQLAGLLLQWRLVVGLAVSMVHHLVFYLVKGAVLFLWGLRFAQLPLPQLTLGGFSAFSVTGCLTYCYSGGVGWAATLPLYFCASPAPAGLQGLAGFCTLCQGAPVGVVSALWATL